MKHLLKDANGSGSSTPFVDSSGNTVTFKSGVWDRIKDNMVLWYDLKRQGSTNETMKANPKLIDLSGNGHDAACYNFVWKEMSGIGGYYFTGLHYDTTLGHYEYTATPDRSKYTFIKNIDSTNHFLYSFVKSVSVGDNVHYKIKITGLDNFRKKHPSSSMSDAQGHVFTKDGIYEHSFSANYEQVTVSLEAGAGSKFEENEEINITVEQLPFYPNAIVADGIDDYIQAINIPALDDYTIICKRKIFHFPSTSRGLIQKGEMINGKAANTFLLEFSSRVSKIDVAVSFDSITNITLETNDITYQTKYSYNGKINLNIGKLIDNVNNFNIALYKGSGGIFYLPCALYSCILFNRTLTTKEINWVKTNLIEGDTEL